VTSVFPLGSRLLGIMEGRSFSKAFERGYISLCREVFDEECALQTGSCLHMSAVRGNWRGFVYCDF
jgi:hypothetical protein